MTSMGHREVSESEVRSAFGTGDERIPTTILVSWKVSSLRASSSPLTQFHGEMMLAPMGPKAVARGKESAEVSTEKRSRGGRNSPIPTQTARRAPLRKSLSLSQYEI